MTPREIAAFNAGIETVRQMALTTAVTIEVRDDASRVQNQAAVAALQALAEGAKELMIGVDRPQGVQQASLAIAADPADHGTVV